MNGSIVLVILVLMFVPCAEGGRSHSVNARIAETATLAFSVERMTQSPDTSGLIVAAWNDGLVVFALDPDRPGKSLQRGRIKPEEVARALDDLQAAGFFEKLPDPGIAPDTELTAIHAQRSDQKNLHQWNEALTVPFGAHVGAADGFRQFVRMWTLSRIAMAFSCPSVYTPLSEDAEATARVKKLLPGFKVR